MADVDHFKSYNDAKGHLEGDVALCKVAELLNDQCKRIGDVCARYGGEEFTMLFAEMSENSLERKLSDIMQVIHTSALSHPCSPTAKHITITMGVLVIQANDVSDYKLPQNELFRLADKALYKAKEAGRDRFVIK